MYAIESCLLGTLDVCQIIWYESIKLHSTEQLPYRRARLYPGDVLVLEAQVALYEH